VAPAPRRPENRPALSAIAYRVGTYATFRAAMRAAIARSPELVALTTRRSDDYAITVLELWAAVADVLTFHQERYANEVFLRTARFRESVSRLAALLDYRLRPGVASRTFLAFTLDAGKQLTVPIGQRVQSVPEQGQQPQTFETTEAIDADARFNRLRVFAAPAPLAALAVGRGSAILDRLQGPTLAGTFAAGDDVVLFNDGATAAVEEKTIASLERRDDLVELRWTVPVQRSGWTASTRVRRFRGTFRLFGHDAPGTFMVPSTIGGSASRIRWSLTTLGSPSLPAGNTLLLDGRFEVAAGQALLVADTAGAGQKTLVTVTSVAQVAATFGPRSDTVTQLTVTPTVPAIGSRREVVVYQLDGPPLAFWEFAYPPTLGGDAVHLPGVAVADDEGPAIEVGRTIERNAFKPGVVIRTRDIAKGRGLLVEDARGRLARAAVRAEPTLDPTTAPPGAFCHLVLPLTVEGTLAHDSASAVVLGNVAAASHGETVRDEVVGSGDAAARFQRMVLRKKPLTHLPATGPEGVASTLELRVSGVRWQEVPGLFGRAPTESVFEARPAEDGSTVLQFGDGVTGAVPPSGRGNVVATYRIGVGLAGRVKAGALTTLLEKPPGLSAARNPAAPEGGADPEEVDAARDNAPRTVRTFGRAVSLLDFEDTVTASGEVAKALATFVWDGLDRAIHLTIAGQEGAAFSPTARRTLGTTLNGVRDPNHRLRIANYARVPITVRAGVAVEPTYDQDTVLAAAHAAIVDWLSFARLRLGQSLHLSDLFRVAQDVPGVRFVDVDHFLFKKPAGLPASLFPLYVALRGGALLPGGAPAPVQGHLRIFSARPHPSVRGAVLPAELAALESPSLDVLVEPRQP
jgi:hypothetical protein